MKKLISVLLAALMLACILPLGAFADNAEKSDTIRFDQSISGTIYDYTTTSENGCFTLSTRAVDANGWRGGTEREWVTVCAAYDGLTITRIEAVVSAYGDAYGDVEVTGGAVKEPDSAVEDGETVSVTGINSPEFSFTGGGNWSQFKDITVYYTDNHTHRFDSSGNCSCGVQICDFEGHHDFGDDRKCRYCDTTLCDIGEHDFDDDGNCRYCDTTLCDIGEHDYAYLCRRCGVEAPEGYVPDDGGEGSTLSEGTLTVVCTVAAAAIFGLGGFLLGRKKKSAEA